LESFAIFKILTNQNFPKEEKLKSKKLIQSVFKEGKHYYNYPLKIFFLTHHVQNHQPLLQVLVSVPKKNFKKAVSRNRLKRQLREVYRLNKSYLLEKINQSGHNACMSIVYIAKKAEPYHKINHSYLSLIEKVQVEKH